LYHWKFQYQPASGDKYYIFTYYTEYLGIHQTEFFIPFVFADFSEEIKVAILSTKEILSRILEYK